MISKDVPKTDDFETVVVSVTDLGEFRPYLFETPSKLKIIQDY
jgi:hypothetical protein